MNYGKPLIELRQQLELSIEAFAAKCKVPVEVITKNELQPHKTNKEHGKSMWTNLGLSIEFYAALCVEDADVKPEKLELYRDLAPVVKDLIFSFMVDDFKQKRKPRKTPIMIDTINSLVKPN